MRGIAAGRNRLLLAALGVLVALSAVSPAVAAADTAVAVLGVRSIEGDDEFTRNLTGAIRNAAKRVDGWDVMRREVSLSQMILIHGCEEPDTACLAKIAASLEAQVVIYGTTRRTSADAEYDFAITLGLYNHEAGRVEDTVTDEIPKVFSDIDDLRQRALRYVMKLGGQAQYGTLRVNVNVPRAEVRIDGEVAGLADSEGNYVAENVPAGARRIEIIAEDHQSFRGAVTVVADEDVALAVALEKVGSNQPSSAASAITSTGSDEPLPPGPDLRLDDDDDDNLPARIGGIALIAIGTASLGGAVVSWLELQSIEDDNTYSSYRSLANRNDNVCSLAQDGQNSFTRPGDDEPVIVSSQEIDRVKDLCSDGDFWEAMQYVFLGVAAVGIGLGTYLVIISADDEPEDSYAKKPPTLSLRPHFGFNEASMTATLRF